MGFRSVCVWFSNRNKPSTKRHAQVDVAIRAGVKETTARDAAWGYGGFFLGSPTGNTLNKKTRPCGCGNSRRGKINHQQGTRLGVSECVFGSPTGNTLKTRHAHLDVATRVGIKETTARDAAWGFGVCVWFSNRKYPQKKTRSCGCGNSRRDQGNHSKGRGLGFRSVRLVLQQEIPSKNDTPMWQLEVTGAKD